MRDLQELRAALAANKGNRLRISREAQVSYRTIQRILDDPTYCPRGDTMQKIDAVIGSPAAQVVATNDMNRSNGQSPVSEIAGLGTL